MNKDILLALLEDHKRQQKPLFVNYQRGKYKSGKPKWRTGILEPSKHNMTILNLVGSWSIVELKKPDTGVTINVHISNIKRDLSRYPAIKSLFGYDDE